MYIADATELIRVDQIAGARAQTWCDLGCGTGTFTLALHQTPGGSHRKATDLSERLLVVEYDGRPPSPWVPYPLGFSVLRGLLLERGFSEIAKLGTRASRFGGELYSALAEWQDE